MMEAFSTKYDFVFSTLNFSHSDGFRLLSFYRSSHYCRRHRLGLAQLPASCSILAWISFVPIAFTKLLNPVQPTSHAFLQPHELVEHGDLSQSLQFTSLTP